MIFDNVSSYVELNLKECGTEVCIPTKEIIYSKKDYYLFHYVLSGKGYFKINGKEYHLKKGYIFLIPPHCDCEYCPDRSDPWTYIWVGFNGTLVKTYLEKIGFNDDNYIFKDNDSLNLKKYFIDIHSEYFKNSYMNIICLGLTYELFGTLIKNTKVGKKTITSSESYIISACEFIKNNYQFDIRINDIAKSIGVVPNYLIEVFHNKFNTSPKQYLTKIRMEKAMELLKEGKHKIKDVAVLVGYKNQLHFSHEFKNYYDVSPSSVKKENIIN